MIKSVTITNHLGEGLLIELRSPEKSGFFIKSIDGLGPPKADINTTEVLSFDGSFYNSSRLVSRNIVFNLGFYNDGTETIEAIRLKTYRFFPSKKPITVKVITDSRTGLTTGYVETNEPDIFSKEEGTTISLICPSSLFSGEETIITSFNGTTSLFEFPWENPSLTLPLIEFGNIFINTAQSVVYSGDEPTGIIMTINFLGAVSGLTLYNVTLGQTMAIDTAKVSAIMGSTFQAGDQLILSTIKGNKFIYGIRAGLYYNLLNALSTSANWFTLERGDNVFTYTATSGLSNVQASVQHKILYRGL